MAGWSTVVQLPFVPRRAIEEFHLNVAHRENLISLVLFFLLSTSFYALYSAHLVWTRLPGGKFLFGLVVLASAICLNNFIYVLVADIFSDARQKQKRIGHLMLSTLAISGAFSLMGSLLYEVGVLGLSQFRYALATGVLLLLVWQCAVEASNLRRVYGYGRFRALVIEVFGRSIGAVMAFSFIGVLSGVSRPWTHWRDLLWIYGVA